MGSRSNRVRHGKLQGPSTDFLLRVEKEVLEGCRGIAKSRQTTVSQVMRDALRTYLKTDHDKPIVAEKPKAWWN